MLAWLSDLSVRSCVSKCHCHCHWTSTRKNHHWRSLNLWILWPTRPLIFVSRCHSPSFALCFLSYYLCEGSSFFLAHDNKSTFDIHSVDVPCSQLTQLRADHALVHTYNPLAYSSSVWAKHIQMFVGHSGLGYPSSSPGGKCVWRKCCLFFTMIPVVWQMACINETFSFRDFDSVWVKPCVDHIDKFWLHYFANQHRFWSFTLLREKLEWHLTIDPVKYFIQLMII